MEENASIYIYLVNEDDPKQGVAITADLKGYITGYVLGRSDVPLRQKIGLEIRISKAEFKRWKEEIMTCKIKYRFSLFDNPKNIFDKISVQAMSPWMKQVLEPQ